MDVVGVLKNLNIGRRVAEEEKDQLAAYFVETDQWRRIYSGDVDIVYGAKGSGKSAIYSILLSRQSDLFDRGVLIESAENPQGTPAFSNLVQDPPTSEEEFVGLWKFYVLSLVAKVIDDYGVSNESSKALLDILAEIGLLPQKRTLASLVTAALGYVRRLLNPEAIEAGVKLDPVSGAPTGVTAKITLREPTDEERGHGTISLNDALALADTAMSEAKYSLWILFDRLDVAFNASPALEANALRALFQVYVDFLAYPALQPKVFLRSDIWTAITEEGFREASHITRAVTIDWDGPSLLNLVVRRLLQNADLLNEYGVTPDDVLSSSAEQETFFYRVFPAQVESGPRKPTTFNWMLGRTRDGSRATAPRELIHLLSSAREVQIKQIELGQPAPEDGRLFTEQAIKDALPEVSRVRLNQTLFAEYPDLKSWIEDLEGGKTDQSPETLGAAWSVAPDEVRGIAGRLVDVGFFEDRGTKQAPRFWVPFLYRPALNLIQGTAED